MIYNEENGKKTAIIQVYNTPKVEGVIIVANGVDDSEIKQKISTAIGNLLGVASYKVQVFASQSSSIRSYSSILYIP